jgi:hypothetical protein
MLSWMDLIVDSSSTFDFRKGRINSTTLSPTFSMLGAKGSSTLARDLSIAMRVLSAEDCIIR